MVKVKASKGVTVHEIEKRLYGVWEKGNKALSIIVSHDHPLAKSLEGKEFGQLFGKIDVYVLSADIFVLVEERHVSKQA